MRRSDGFYVQFCVQVDRVEEIQPTGSAIGLDVGLKEFYKDCSVCCMTATLTYLGPLYMPVPLGEIILQPCMI